MEGVAELGQHEVDEGLGREVGVPDLGRLVEEREEQVEELLQDAEEVLVLAALVLRLRGLGEQAEQADVAPLRHGPGVRVEDRRVERSRHAVPVKVLHAGHFDQVDRTSGRVPVEGEQDR